MVVSLVTYNSVQLNPHGRPPLPTLHQHSDVPGFYGWIEYVIDNGVAIRVACEDPPIVIQLRLRNSGHYHLRSGTT